MTKSKDERRQVSARAGIIGEQIERFRDMVKEYKRSENYYRELARQSKTMLQQRINKDHADRDELAAKTYESMAVALEKMVVEKML